MLHITIIVDKIIVVVAFVKHVETVQEEPCQAQEMYFLSVSQKTALSFDIQRQRIGLLKDNTWRAKKIKEGGRHYQGWPGWYVFCPQIM